MVKRDPNAFVTNADLDSAVDTLLKGMDNMLEEQKKIFATKEDLKREVSWLRDDIKGFEGELADTVSRKDFIPKVP